MIEFLLSGGPEGTNDLLYLIISNDGHYYYYYYWQYGQSVDLSFRVIFTDSEYIYLFGIFE